MFLGGFFIPLLLIIVFYVSIVILLKKNEIYLTYHIRYINQRSSEISTVKSIDLGKDKANAHLENEKKLRKINKAISNGKKISRSSSICLKREVKLIKMVALIVIMFIIAWLPYAIVALLAQFGSNIERYINPFTTSLPALFAKTSSIYNPLIYTISNKEFRRFFFKFFLKKEIKNLLSLT